MIKTGERIKTVQPRSNINFVLEI